MILNNFRLRATKFFVKKWAISTSITKRIKSDKCLTNYQHFVGGDISTFHFQSSLPRLPIPELEETCRNYLRAVRPLIHGTDYITTERIVNDFRLGEGAELQRKLIELDKLNQRTSYVSKPWMSRFLSFRAPLPISWNPVAIMELDSRHELNNQLIKTCNIVISTLRLMRSIQTNSLEPTMDYSFRSEVRKKIVRKIIRWTPESLATQMGYWLKVPPKDMAQFQRIFGATRIPEHKRDVFVQYDNSKHIIVLKRGRIYSVQVLNEVGDIETPEVIFNRINQIYQLKLVDTKCSIATFTTLERESWANWRKYLSDILGNKIQLREIDSALFCVSIEHSKSLEHVSQYNVLLAGDGKNRWFDKSITMAVDGCGTVGISFEHSWGDGLAILRINDEVYNDSTKSPYITPANANPTETTTSIPNAFVREIEFNVDATVESGIEQAIENHTHRLNSIQVNNFRFNKLNKKLCKSLKLSSDAILQLGFQLAFFKQRGETSVPTYEPCSTLKFLHGRTEAILPCTIATQQFCYAISQKTKTNSELFALINRSSQLHSSIIQQSANGQGYNRHLYCLKYLAQEEGLDEPQLFRDNAYKMLTRNTLVTTSVSSKALNRINIGPPTVDGYGIWYRMDDDGIYVTMSHYHEHVNGALFLDALAESLNDIFKVIESEKFN